MKFALSLGVAFAALTLAASAHSDHPRVVRHHGAGPDLNIDANADGWLTRAEASAAADRIFERMDGNDDGRLDREDHASLRTFDVHVDGPEIEVLEGGDGERRVRVIRRGGERDEIIEREVERAVRDAERAVAEAERAAESAEHEAERAAERAERHGEREAERAAERAEREVERAEREIERAERDVERHVVIIRGDGGGEWRHEDGLIAPLPPTPAVPPVPAVPPHAPMFMMLIANSEEADLNGDAALSREEFRAQHLRFFDASDANGDGRVRYERPVPPVPPVAPVAPTPPQPPRPR